MIGIDSAPVRLTKTFRKPDYQRPSATHLLGIHSDPKGASRMLKTQIHTREQSEDPGFHLPPTQRVTLETVLPETGAHQAPALIHDSLLHI